MFSLSTDLATTYLCVDVLKVGQPVLTVLRVSDVILSHQLITSGRKENAIDEVSYCARVVLLISLVPLGRDIIGCIPGAENVGCTMVRTTRLVITGGVDLP